MTFLKLFDFFFRKLPFNFSFFFFDVEDHIIGRSALDKLIELPHLTGVRAKATEANHTIGTARTCISYHPSV